MLWGCFSANSPGNLVKVESIMRKEQYTKVLTSNLTQSAENLDQVKLWTFQQNNDPNYATNVVKWRLQDNDHYTDWPRALNYISSITYGWSWRQANLKDLENLTKLIQNSSSNNLIKKTQPYEISGWQLISVKGANPSLERWCTPWMVTIVSWDQQRRTNNPVTLTFTPKDE